MNDTVKVTSESTLSNSFLGDTIQVCVVTRDLRKTCEGMVKMGIGPWRVYTFSPETVRDLSFRGKPASFSMRLALATSGNMMWEVIQPLEGDSIYTEYLAQNRDGVQHVGQACMGVPFDEQVKAFEARGCEMIQSGNWNDVRFAYFDTAGTIGTTVEIFDFPEGFVFPEPEEWIPAKP